MCDMCDGTSATELREQFMADYAKYGHQVRFVGGSDVVGEWPFAYTLGRCMRDLPELFMVGVGAREAVAILNEAARLQEAGELVIEHGTETGLLTMNYTSRFIECDPYASVMSGATSLDPACKAFQIVWPDANGIFPGEDGCALPEGGQVTYPLGVDHIYAEVDVQGTAISATALCGEHVITHAEEHTSVDGITVHILADGNDQLACQVCGKQVP